MATLEKRIEALERAAGATDGSRILLRLPDKEGNYEPVPDGFTGKVMRVVFGKRAATEDADADEQP